MENYKFELHGVIVDLGRYDKYEGFVYYRTDEEFFIRNDGTRWMINESAYFTSGDTELTKYTPMRDESNYGTLTGEVTSVTGGQTENFKKWDANQYLIPTIPFFKKLCFVFYPKDDYNAYLSREISKLGRV